MQTAIAHQHDTLDDILYRTRGDTSAIAALMDANPHALHSPRLAEGLAITIPPPPPQEPNPAPLKLWD